MTERAFTEEELARRAKRQAMMDQGVNPYPSDATVTADAATLEASYANLADGEDTEDEVSVVGRIRALRRQGKIAFIVIQDSTGSLQLFCRVNNLSEGDWALIKTLDVGDIVGATGFVMRTRKGQLSVAPTSVTLLSKALRPLPEKFHGLKDTETRYRQRYADMIVNDDVRHTFEKRARMVSAIRRYMDSEGYLEVETPILQATLGGANARPFATHHNALDMDFYLRIATELHLKRLIVGGIDRVYELGRQFRNEGMDPFHNPEFTTIEAYRAYTNLDGMKALAQGIFQAANEAVNDSSTITYQGTEIDLSGTWAAPTMAELVSEAVGEAVDVHTDIERLRELCDRYEIPWEPQWGPGKLLYTLYDAKVQDTLVNPTFVCDFPTEVSPLAKKREDDPLLTQRFELIICGEEYANAFTELNDPVDQEERFRAQVEAKAAGDDEAMEYDSDYIRALEYAMPPTGGIGIGIDRLAMLLLDQPSIRDVLPFPHMRPEGTQPEGVQPTDV